MSRRATSQSRSLNELRQFVHNRAAVRYPTSTARRRTGILLLALFGAFVFVYSLSTTNESIRQRAIRVLKKLTPGGVDIEVGRASFKMFEGITLYDVHIYLPFDEDVDPNAHDRKDREVFSVAKLQLTHNPWLLLVGDLHIESVLAVKPHIVLTYNVETGKRNWELLFRDRKRSKDRKLLRPVIKIRSAEAWVVGVDKDGTDHKRQERLDADIRPSIRARTGYDVEIRRYSAPIGRASVYFDPIEGTMSNTPFFATGTVKTQLPAGAQELFDSLSVEGDVRLGRYVFDRESEADRDTRIGFRGVQCIVPLWLVAASTRPSPDDPTNADMLLPLVELDNLVGSVELIANDIHIDVNGLMNGVPCMVKGTLIRGTGDVTTWGLDLRISADDIAAPEGDVRNRVLADARFPKDLRDFLEDFDPYGQLDIDLHLLRKANSPGTLRVNGTIRPRGLSGSARWFPFRLDNITGQARFDGPDIYIEGIRGTHGTGAAMVNGHIDDRPDYSAIDLEILATAIPLDIELFAAMSDRYQGIWQRFMPYGTADLRVVLHREGGPKPGPRPNLFTKITADLRDVVGIFRPWPRRITDIDGRLEIDEDRIRIIDLTCRADGAPVLLDGYAILEPNRPTEIDLRIEATDLPLDDEIATAFGETLAEFHPAGSVDLLGTLFQRGGHDELQWDIDAILKGGRIKYDAFPYALTDVSADVSVEPDRVLVRRLEGHNGDSNVSATASWDKSAGENKIDLKVESSSLRLTDELRLALPEVVRDVWDMLSPGGKVRVSSHHLFSGPETARVHSHQTTIDLMSNTARFESLPLPLSGLRGQVYVDSNGVSIRGVTGQVGSGQIRIDGQIRFDNDRLVGDLKIDAMNIELTKAFIDACPKDLAGWLRKASSSGGFSAKIPRLHFERDAAGKLRWDVQGRVDLAKLSGNLGVELRNVDGYVEGRCSIDPDAGILIDTQIQVSRVELGGWTMTNARGRLISQPQAGALMIEDGIAQVYGGEATGYAEIRFGGKKTEYEAAVIFRDVLLQNIVAEEEAGRRPESRADAADHESAKGTIAGNFALEGVSGRSGFRQGAGEVHISNAQVWKLPFVLSIFQVLNLAPDENVFHDGRLELFLVDDVLTLHKIDLQGKAMAFIGGGVMNLDTGDLDLRLLAASPIRIEVPILTEILEGMAREASEISVTGNIDNPRIRPEPFGRTRDVIDTLFPEIPTSRSGR